MSASSSSTSSPWPSLLASATAGFLTRIPCHPIDTCKARLQSQGAKIPGMDALQAGGGRGSGVVAYRGLVDALSTIVRAEGWRALYRGFGVTALGSAPALCLYLSSYEWCKEAAMQNLDFCRRNASMTHLTCGLFAEAVSCVLWVPIDVTKERLQIQRLPSTLPEGQGGDMMYRNSVDALRKIARTEGMFGLYKGYGATLLSFGPFSALYFMFYEESKVASQRFFKYASTDDMPFALHVTNSVIAGCCASFVTNPLDLIKLRLQVQRGVAHSGGKVPWGGRPYTGFFDGLRQLYAVEGFAALFRGVTARMAFSGPSTAISMGLYESLHTFWKKSLKN